MSTVDIRMRALGNTHMNISISSSQNVPILGLTKGFVALKLWKNGTGFEKLWI